MVYVNLAFLSFAIGILMTLVRNIDHPYIQSSRTRFLDHFPVLVQRLGQRSPYGTVSRIVAGNFTELGPLEPLAIGMLDTLKPLSDALSTRVHSLMRLTESHSLYWTRVTGILNDLDDAFQLALRFLLFKFVVRKTFSHHAATTREAWKLAEAYWAKYTAIIVMTLASIPWYAHAILLITLLLCAMHLDGSREDSSTKRPSLAAPSPSSDPSSTTVMDHPPRLISASQDGLGMCTSDMDITTSGTILTPGHKEASSVHFNNETPSNDGTIASSGSVIGNSIQMETGSQTSEPESLGNAMRRENVSGLHLVLSRKEHHSVAQPMPSSSSIQFPAIFDVQRSSTPPPPTAKAPLADLDRNASECESGGKVVGQN